MHNFPIYSFSKPHPRPFYEVWYLKWNQPPYAGWLRFTLLVSKGHFKKLAQVWAIFFKNTSSNTEKWAFRENYPLDQVKNLSSHKMLHLKFGPCLFQETHSKGQTHGALSSQGRTFSWNLSFKKKSPFSFDFVPTVLKKLHIVQNTVWSVSEHLVFSGKVQLGKKNFSFKNAPGMQGHLAGPKQGAQWAWAHSACFENEKGQAVPILFDGLSAKAKLIHTWTTPTLSSFFIFYKNKVFSFKTLRDQLHMRSNPTLTHWDFSLTQQRYTFHGTITASPKKMVGLIYEDTDQSQLFCANSKIASMTLEVSYQGKREGIYFSKEQTAYELVTRKKSPYLSYEVF